AHMIHIAGVEKTFARAEAKAWKVLRDGSALEEFRKLVAAQGGLVEALSDYSLLPHAETETVVRAPKNGFVKMFDNEKVGLLLIDLGGGRKMKTDVIDHAVGFIFHKKIGDSMKKGDPLLTIHHHPQQQKLVDQIAKTFVTDVIQFSSAKIRKPRLILEKLS
ncbi:MAG: pyrimidine-nucleoside phosphorylase, partial [Bacteriovoracaceae bacterium]